MRIVWQTDIGGSAILGSLGTSITMDKFATTTILVSEENLRNQINTNTFRIPYDSNSVDLAAPLTNPPSNVQYLVSAPTSSSPTSFLSQTQTLAKTIIKTYSTL